MLDKFIRKSLGIVERKIRQKQEVRNSILLAAWQLVEREGWQALSIRKIADAIEYSIPVIYQHFDNKEAILLEFIKQGFGLLTQELQAARTVSPLPSQQLMDMARAYSKFAFEHKHYYQLMYGMGMPACETVNQVEEMQAFSQVLLQVIGEAIAQSQCPATNDFLKFHTYWSILHGLVSIQMIESQQGPNGWHDQVLEDAVNGFIQSLN